MTKQRFIKELQSIFDDLSQRSKNADELSKNRNTGFPESFYDELYGRALAFQWSAEEVENLLTKLSSD